MSQPTSRRGRLVRWLWTPEGLSYGWWRSTSAYEAAVRAFFMRNASERDDD